MREAREHTAEVIPEAVAPSLVCQEHSSTPGKPWLDEVKPLAVSVDEFCRLTSIGRTTAFALIRDKRLEVRRIGGRTLVLMRSIEALLELNDGLR